MPHHTRQIPAHTNSFRCRQFPNDMFFGPLGLSFAPYVRSSRTLSKWLKPVANWYANLSGYRRVGLLYDDLSAYPSIPSSLPPSPRQTPRTTHFHPAGPSSTEFLIPFFFFQSLRSVQTSKGCVLASSSVFFSGCFVESFVTYRR